MENQETEKINKFQKIIKKMKNKIKETEDKEFFRHIENQIRETQEKHDSAMDVAVCNLENTKNLEDTKEKHDYASIHFHSSEEDINFENDEKDVKVIGKVKETLDTISKQLEEDHYHKYLIEARQASLSQQEDFDAKYNSDDLEGFKIIGSTKDLVDAFKKQATKNIPPINDITEGNYPDAPKIPINKANIETLRGIKDDYSQYHEVGDEIVCRISAEKLFDLFLLGDEITFHISNRSTSDLISCTSFLKEKGVNIFLNLTQYEEINTEIHHDDISASYIRMDYSHGGSLFGPILGKELKEFTENINEFYSNYHEQWVLNNEDYQDIDIYSILNKKEKKDLGLFSRLVEKISKYFKNEKSNSFNNFSIIDSDVISHILNKSKIKIIKVYG